MGHLAESVSARGLLRTLPMRPLPLAQAMGHARAAMHLASS